MKSVIAPASLVIALVATTPLAVSAPSATSKDQRDLTRVEETTQAFEKRDPDIKSYFERAYGYAVFPRIVKGGAGVGGAHGRGLVFARDGIIGSATVWQGTVGFQLGGQVYSEIIFFEHEAALNRFKQNRLEFAVQASAVAVKAGAAASSGYENGVVVFVMPKKGLMAEAAIGGQKFSFTPNL